MQPCTHCYFITTNFFKLNFNLGYVFVLLLVVVMVVVVLGRAKKSHSLPCVMTTYTHGEL